MIRKLMLAALAALLVGGAGCRHRCHKAHHKDGCCPTSSAAPGGRSPILLPPAGVPTTPGPSVLPPGTSGFPPPAAVDPLTSPPPAAKGGTETLFPDPLPAGPSSRPSQSNSPGILGAPVKPQTVEPQKTAAPNYTRVKDGLFAGRKPTLDGFDALKTAGFRSVVYLHAAGADVSAIKDMAATRGLAFHAIETTPESLAEASAEFNRVAADRLNRPAYVFGEDDLRAGAVWYLHLRTVDSLGDDVARLRAAPLGLSEQGDEGRAFALAIQRVLETK